MEGVLRRLGRIIMKKDVIDVARLVKQDKTYRLRSLTKHVGVHPTVAGVYSHLTTVGKIIDTYHAYPKRAQA